MVTHKNPKQDGISRNGDIYETKQKYRHDDAIGNIIIRIYGSMETWNNSNR